MLFLYHEGEEDSATEPVSSRENYFTRLKDAFYSRARKILKLFSSRKTICHREGGKIYQVSEIVRHEPYDFVCLISETGDDRFLPHKLELLVSHEAGNEFNGSETVVIVKYRGQCGLNSTENLLILSQHARMIRGDLKIVS